MSILQSSYGPNPFWVDATGAPLVSGKLYTYLAGSNTKAVTYTDSTGLSTNTNPIILNALGQTPNGYFWQSGLSYEVVLSPSTDTDPPTSPIFTKDNLSAINDVSSVFTQSEWIAFGNAPTFISATSFSLVGNQTATLQPGRRILTSNTGGIRYSTIASSVFGAVTTITVVNDSGVLDSGLSAVSYGFLSSTNQSIPPVRGTVTNDNATAGVIGEYVSSIIAFASRITGLITGTAVNITSISLTAGDWDVDGVTLFLSSTGATTGLLCSINTTSAAINASDAQTGWNSGAVGTVAYQSVQPPTVRMSLAVTTTVYLVSRADFSSGTADSWGSIRARRAR